MSEKTKSPAVDETAGRRLEANSLAAEYVSAFNTNRFPLCRPHLQPNFTHFGNRILIHQKGISCFVLGVKHD